MFRLYWIQTLKLQLFPVTDHWGYGEGIGLCRSVVCHSQKTHLLLQFCTLCPLGLEPLHSAPVQVQNYQLISMYLLFE